ncbi:MAG: GPR endopeptidase, partial [Oscillospiraceae bacterium]|nr:GPR endopeptidase [Oscillospiraceae bacterium]
VTTVHIKSEQAAETLRKPIGSYITIEAGKPLSIHDHIMSVGECLAEVLDRVLRPYYHGKLCVCGIGNRDLTADALGPEVLRNLPVKLVSELGQEGNFREVVSLEPGIEGANNINTEVLVDGVVKAAGVDCLLLVDSLAAGEPARMFQTIQLSTSGGLSPHLTNRKADWSALGIPVISLGVPMAIPASVLLPGQGLGARSFTSTEVQFEIAAAGRIIAYAILRACLPSRSAAECFLLSGLNSESVPFDLDAWNA